MPSETAAAPQPLEGRRALVTAGSSGIGLATAGLLRAQGANVFITGTSDRTAEVADAIGAAGHAIADFTRPAAPAEAAAGATAALGGIDILVSNTGGPRPAAFADLDDAEWLAAYHLILGSAVALTRAVNVIAPGPIDTDRRRRIMSFQADRHGVETADFEAREREQIPLRRFGGADEVASLAAYLASEPAGFITGAVHVIDGGFTAA